MRAILSLGVPVQIPNNKQDKKNKITRFLKTQWYWLPRQKKGGCAQSLIYLFTTGAENQRCYYLQTSGRYLEGVVPILPPIALTDGSSHTHFRSLVVTNTIVELTRTALTPLSLSVAVI